MWVKYHRLLAAAWAAGVFLFNPISSAAESPLPQSVKDAFSHIESIDRSLEGRRWKEALTRLRDVQEVTVRVIREVGDAADENFLYHVGYSCGRLEASLRRGDRDSSEDYYRDLHDLYLRLANNLTSGEPMTLKTIRASLLEAGEWNRKSNYREVVFGLRRISRYFRGIYPLLEAKGVEHPEIWKFHGEVNRAMAAAEVGSEKRTAQSLEILFAMTESFSNLFPEQQAGRRTAP